MVATLCPQWQKIKQHWVAIAVVAIVLVVVIALIIAIILFNGTGFNGYNKVTITSTIRGTNAGTVTRTEEYQPGKALWDWMQLLIIPVVLAIGGFWLNRIQNDREKEATKRQQQAERDAEIRQKDKEKQQEKRAEQKALLRKLYLNIIQAYNAAKRVRRLLRATARSISPDDGAMMIMIAPYSEQMQALIDIQLQFETFIDEVESNPTLFSGNAGLDRVWARDKLKSDLGSIENYLNSLVGEYEDLYKTVPPNATPTLPIAKLPKLGEFIGKYSSANDFRTKLKAPAHQVMEALLNLLTSE